jgi:ATP-dependent RNA helicase SUPV3L1/SUV3
MSIASRQWRLPLRAVSINSCRVRYRTTTIPPPRPTVHSLLQSFPSNKPIYDSSNWVLRFDSSKDVDQFISQLDPLLAQLKKDYYESFSFDDLPVPETQLKGKFATFEHTLRDAITNPYKATPALKEFAFRLETIWRKDNLGLLYTVMKKEFYRGLMNIVFTPQHLKNHMALADFRYPLEAFPAARRLKRTIHLHVGPTNSGKTYHALKRLREATGDTLFAGPLRMLAQEIYARMNATGKPTWLITGDDKRPPTGDISHNPRQANISCTVEMAPLNHRYEVAVIDEIQMIADPSRGAHWTNALLGLCADEIHLCGEERSTNVIQQIADSLGEELIIHRYNRLTDLEIMPSIVGSWEELEKGDCVVGFAVKKLHSIRTEIEQTTGKKCAIVYGGLPSEVRTEQARLFNDPNNDYDYLVATNAIGMGLNLAIRRVIFTATSSRIANTVEQLPVSDIKQIGGRAGRFRTSYQDTHAKASSTSPVTDVDDGATPEAVSTPEKTVGLVTACSHSDLAYVNTCFKADVAPIERVGFQPGAEAIARFYSYFPPGIPYSLALVRLADIIRLPANFFAKDIDDTINIADAIEKVKGLRIEDRIQICNAPVSINIPAQSTLIVAMANAVSVSGDGGLLQLPMDLDVLDVIITDDVDRTVLTRLEDLHKGLVLYCWMSFRFPSVFVDRALAIETRTITQEAITKVLALIKSTTASTNSPPSKRRAKVDAPRLESSTPRSNRPQSDGFKHAPTLVKRHISTVRSKKEQDSITTRPSVSHSLVNRSTTGRHYHSLATSNQFQSSILSSDFLSSACRQ